ncbi:MAG: DNA mismatch repair protein MutS [Eubacteriales bacterium]
MAEMTPMMKQYFEMKKQYPDSILFFRLGDFYEMFHQDAITVAQELNLTLTSRDRGKPEEERTPMCGIPYHASETYLAKLVSKGYKIAICEQMEDPSKTKTIVKRDVVRVVTPGTLMETAMLEERQNNYLAVVYTPTAEEMVENWGEIVLCFCDISTGRILLRNMTLSDTVIQEACNELSRFSPKEVLLSTGAMGQRWIRDFLQEGLSLPLEEGEGFSVEEGKKAFKKQFPEETAPKSKEILCALGGLFHFLHKTQKMDLTYLASLQYLNAEDFMELSVETRRNLELTETLWSREKKGSLLWVLDKTKTSMGGRMLRDWMQRPLLSVSKINKRQSAVCELKENLSISANLEDILKEIPDLERMTARIGYGSASPKDLRGLAEGLEKVSVLKEKLSSLQSEKLKSIQEKLEDLPQLTELLLAALQEELPVSIREGGMIRKGFHEEVDKLNHVVDNGAQLIAELEYKTKEETGIRNLKVRYNRVFGYFIEVAKAQSDAVPSHWVRKQTVTNSERYISEELKDLEHMILTAKDKVTALEYEIFKKLQEEVCKFIKIIQETAQAAAELDVLNSFATVARKGNYVQPEITETSILSIRNGRHPVVEKMLKDGLFVPNDSNFVENKELCAVITGANMSGKSTYMRQVALIVLMSQMGSFVPAYSAQVGIVDQIFTRIGASDDLAAGRSTFMVEMSEVATLLKSATERSLLVLDEIGRGTSTYDGMAMAKAVLEYCREKIAAKTLFATHYHELSVVAEEMSLVNNYNLAAKQQGEELLFLRKLLPGAADQSYGIQVAKLAGVPEEVIGRAYEILQELESSDGKPPIPRVEPVVLPLSPEEIIEKEVVTELRSLDLDNLTPRQSWEILEQLRQKLHTLG